MKSSLLSLACASVLSITIAVPAASVAPAVAQVKPMHSGHMSHGAAQMRRHGSGLHHPNRPAYHHHAGYAGYRPVHDATAYREAEAARGTLVE